MKKIDLSSSKPLSDEEIKMIMKKAGDERKRPTGDVAWLFGPTLCSLLGDRIEDYYKNKEDK